MRERVAHWLGFENIRKEFAPAGGSLYPAEGLERVLNTYFGNAQLAHAACGVAVTTYDYRSKRTLLLRNYSKPEAPSPTDGVLMREAARATSAGPTFFPPASITGLPGVFVDGGITANSPAMVAYIEALEFIHDLEVFGDSYNRAYKKIHPDTADLSPDLPFDLFLVSIGTGVAREKLDDVTMQLVERENWLALARDHLMGALFTGLTELHEEQLDQLLNVVVPGDPRRYFRIQATLQSGNFEMDDARPGNLDGLAEDAERMVKENANALQEIVQQLTAYGLAWGHL